MIGNITILTGAGISQESGIPVFRTSSSGNSNSEEVGLWNGHPLEEVATYEGFLHDKNKVHQFYNDLRMKVMNVSPNLAHVALSKLESTWTYGKVTIITQNVDDLHERALKEIDGISSDDITIPENPNIPSSLTDKNCDCGCYDNNDTGLTIPDDYELSKYKSPNTNIKIIHLHGELMKMCVDGYKENSEYHIQFPYKNKFTLPVNKRYK